MPPCASCCARILQNKCHSQSTFLDFLFFFFQTSSPQNVPDICVFVCNCFRSLNAFTFLFLCKLLIFFVQTAFVFILMALLQPKRTELCCDPIRDIRRKKFFSQTFLFCKHSFGSNLYVYFLFSCLFILTMSFISN